jgi:hypothetical protein
MIRIPTGPVPAQYARAASLGFGLASLVVNHYFPQFLPQLGSVGAILSLLGITIGDASKTPPPAPMKVLS